MAQAFWLKWLKSGLSAYIYFASRMPRFEVIYAKGCAFRRSTRLDDRATEVRPAKKGEVLEADFVGGESWVELSTDEGLFLPMSTPDKPSRPKSQ